ncbi:MAG TPA: hypothetical protein VG779_02655 [Actinomycetota bacterium]|nr:hypothetical protein [Actinomycetota bacterium]
MMSVDPSSQRRHVAARSRTVTALLSVGGFLGIIGSLAASQSAASTSATSTTPGVPAAPAPASTAPAATTGPAVVPVAPAPVQSTAPPTSNNQWNYGGTPARTFNPQPVTRSHASR